MYRLCFGMLLAAASHVGERQRFEAAANGAGRRRAQLLGITPTRVPHAQCALQHIRPSNPTVCLKRALDNDLRAIRHRSPGSRDGVSVDTDALDYRAAKPFALR